MNEAPKIPKQALQAQRQAVLAQVRREQIRKKQFVITATSALLAFVIFVFSVRLSPTIANYVAKIPGFEPIVEMISYNKGLKDIMQHEYYEEIGMMITKNQLTATLVGVIADETGMMISYEIDAPFDLSTINLTEIYILQNGEPIGTSHSYGWVSDKPTKHIESVITATSQEAISYNNNNFDLVLHFNDEHNTVITLPFELQQPIAPTKVYTIDQTLEVQEQKFTVNQVAISPLTTAIDITVDPTNSMRILAFDDLKLIDENGEEWARIENGLTATGALEDGKIRYYMQSNYFRIPKELTLEIGEIHALPKGQDIIEVDFAKERILYQPDIVDWQITVQGKTVTVEADHYEGEGRTLLFTAYDQYGNEIPSGEQSWHDIEYGLHASYTYDDAPYEAPVKIDINYYPNPIGSHLILPIFSNK
ncbi:DUF4179 domain-containing protein [Solibacillus sp. MA9]|uniref:DUF4179 domain-containing protein n=1 Tax=Solibacillus palustris TaxID=2908203 RepID=A0ABS9UFG8_9BACL|nr:DUF4179 domain-containing protein [Solibacillus sp. MA9]MCH7323103.1 DUF4179 domain-containing protein [Solibacillus sp. MA9]